MSISQISVVIIAKNAEDTIEETLQSVKDFNEVILYLNHSTDNTENIAKEYDNVKIVTGEFLGFGQTKNMAVTYSKNDWILSLDSDEILTKQLLEEMAHVTLTDVKNIYKLKRDNYFLGYKIQQVDKIVRIYNRTFTHFNDNEVHEKVLILQNGKVITLENSFKHLNIININQTLTKIIKYTDLSSKDKKMCFFSILIAKSLFSFFKTYVIKGNFLKGWIGFVFSVHVANERYYKYLKLFINCKKHSNSKLIDSDN